MADPRWSPWFRQPVVNILASSSWSSVGAPVGRSGLWRLQQHIFVEKIGETWSVKIRETSPVNGVLGKCSSFITLVFLVQLKPPERPRMARLQNPSPCTCEEARHGILARPTWAPTPIQGHWQSHWLDEGKSHGEKGWNVWDLWKTRLWCCWLFHH